MLYKPRKPRRLIVRESVIVSQIIKWLYWKRVYFWRANSGGYKADSGNFIRFNFPGCPDIVGIMPDGSGRLFGIEVKRPGAKQTEAQIKCMNDWRERGAVYILASSIEEVETGFKEAA